MRTRGIVLLLLAGVILAVGLTGCDWLIASILAPYGYVVDDAGDGLEGITVTLTGASNYTALSGTTGYFEFPEMDSGTYTMTATDPAATDPWQFGSVSVTVADAAQHLGILRGYKALTLTGTVVDSRDAALGGVEGVDLTLTLRSDPTVTYTATTDADGAFSIEITDKSGFVPGDYEVTGAKANYFVAPETVSLNPGATAVGEVQAFSLDAADVYGLSFILVWDSAQDLDLHLSFPTDVPGSTFGPTTGPYFDDFSGTRDRMYYDNKDAPYQVVTGTNAVYMDRDDTDGYGPETMNLIYVTQGTSNGSAADTDTATGLGVFPAGDYDYFGSAELYVDAYWYPGETSYLTELTDGVATSAKAKVYCIQTVEDGTELAASLLGIYTIPEYTTIRSASVLRVLMFKDADVTEWFMIAPDITVVPDGPTVGTPPTFKSLLGSQEIIGVRGKSAR